MRAAQAVQDAAQDVVDRLTEWKTANAAVNQTKTDMTNARNAVAGKAGAALDTALFSLRKAVEAYNEAQKKLEEAKRNLPPTYVIPADIALVDVDITLAQAEVTKAAKAVADAEAEVTKAKAKTRHDEKEAAFNAVKALFDAAVENWTRLKRTVDGGGDGKASAVIEQKLDTVNAKLASLETAVTTHDTSVKGAFVTLNKKVLEVKQLLTELKGLKITDADLKRDFVDPYVDAIAKAIAKNKIPDSLSSDIKEMIKKLKLLEERSRSEGVVAAAEVPQAPPATTTGCNIYNSMPHCSGR